LAQTGLELAQARDDQAATGYALIVLGWVALVRKSYGAALRLFQESTEQCQNIEQKDMVSWGLAFMGYTDCGLHQLTRARQHLHRALEVAQAVQSSVAYKFILSGVALLMANLGEGIRAIEFYALASRYPMIANSQWFADTVGRYITVLADTLPSDVVAQAGKDGQARDLDETLTALLKELPHLAP
jgi:hypothetical protein